VGPETEHAATAGVVNAVHVVGVGTVPVGGIVIPKDTLAPGAMAPFQLSLAIMTWPFVDLSTPLHTEDAAIPQGISTCQALTLVAPVLVTVALTVCPPVH